MENKRKALLKEIKDDQDLSLVSGGTIFGLINAIFHPYRPAYSRYPSYSRGSVIVVKGDNNNINLINGSGGIKVFRPNAPAPAPRAIG